MAATAASAPISASGSASTTSTSTSGCGDQLHRFRYVLQNIQHDAIPTLAMAIRASLSDAPEPGAKCTLQPEPLYGSFNILFRLDFSDGVSWLLKVPARGHPGTFNESDAEALKSEALTMRLIKSQTTIPIPEVYAFDTTLENDVKCPYILMEYIDASPLSIYWFDDTVSEEVREEHRAKILHNLATITSQLNKFVYNEAGHLLYDDNGEVAGIGPVRNYDLEAVIHRAEQQVAEADEDEEDFEDCDDSPLFCEAGPFKNPKEFLLWMLDRRESCKLDYTKGTYQLLRMFVQWFLDGVEPPPDGLGHARFVLAHPDLDLQNILVSPEGEICALIDWDGVGTVPAFMGNNSYPAFLLRDRDPSWFYAAQGNDSAMAQCSAGELSRYREIYQEAVASCLALDSCNARLESDHSSNDALMKTTRRCLIAETLQYATHNAMFTHRVMDLLFSEIVDVVKPTMVSPPPAAPTPGDGDLEESEARVLEESADSTGLAQDFENELDTSSNSSDTFEDKDDSGFEAEELDSSSDLESLSDSGSYVSADLSSNTDHSNHLNAEQQWFDDNFNIYEVGNAIAEDRLDERRLKLLKDGFEALCA